MQEISLETMQEIGLQDAKSQEPSLMQQIGLEAMRLVAMCTILMETMIAIGLYTSTELGLGQHIGQSLMLFVAMCIILEPEPHTVLAVGLSFCVYVYLSVCPALLCLLCVSVCP